MDGEGNETAFNLRGLTLLSRTTDEGKSHFLYNGHGDVTALVSSAGSLDVCKKREGDRGLLVPGRLRLFRQYDNDVVDANQQD